MDLLAELAKGQDWRMGLRAVTRYTYRVGEVSYTDLAEVAEQAMGPGAKEVVVTTAERLLKQGREEGRLEGERRMLLRLLRKRVSSVPEAIQQRIASATEAELELWSERVIDETTLDAVFSEPE